MSNSEPDKITAEAISGMVEQPTFKVYRERIEAMLKFAQLKLEDQRPKMDTAYLRGEIRMLRAVLAIPAVLIDETQPATGNSRMRRAANQRKG